MKRKDLFTAILVSFILITTLLMVMPIKGLTGEPDPWTDVSGTVPGVPDGRVDMRDIAYEVSQFQAQISGVSRDVNVTNWPSTLNANWSSRDDYSQQYYRCNISSAHEGSIEIAVSCGGYSALSLMYLPIGVWIGFNNNMTVALSEIDWVSDINGNSPFCRESINANVYNLTFHSDSNGTLSQWTTPTPFLTSTKAAYCWIYYTVIAYPLGLPTNWWFAFDLCAYLRND